MVRVLHNKCNQVAFYFKEKLKPGDLILASNVLSIEHKPVDAGEQIRCGSCHEPMNSFEIRQESWQDWFIVDDLGG